MYQKKVEARSYDVPFKKLQQPVYWFHDIFQAKTWSDRHRHDHWEELAFMIFHFKESPVNELTIGAYDPVTLTAE